MPDYNVERIITEDVSSGMIHLRLKVNGKMYSHEGCNLDDAGAYRVLPALPEDMEAALFCRNDFPEMHDPHPITNSQED